MKTKFLFIIISILCNFSGFAQNIVLLKVIDSKNGEPIIGANIFAAKDSSYLGLTNSDGEILLKVPKLPYKILISYVSYKDTSITLNNYNTRIIKLLRKDVNISPVVVSAESKYNFLRNYEIGRININTSLLEAKVSFLGEDDPFKFLQIFSGVNFTNELSSSFTVYGSLPSENLILIDGIPVFNVNHLAGFVSVLPGNTAKNITFYKSFMPPKYSGRTASILKISLKDGNTNKTNLNIHISTIATGFTLDGPIIKNKLTYLISFRRSYPDLFLNMFLDKNTKQYINFYDAIGKITWHIRNNTKLQLIKYKTQDNFKFYEQFSGNLLDTVNNINGKIYSNGKLGISWQNDILGLKFSSRIGSNLLFKLYAYSSHYDFNYLANYKQISNYYTVPDSLYSDTSYLLTNFGNFITENAIKFNNNLILNQNLVLEFGAKLGNIKLTPNKFYNKAYTSRYVNHNTLYLKSMENSNDTILNQELFSSYFSLKYTGNKLNTNIGFVVDNYDKYLFIEPRIAINFVLNKNFSTKFSFQRTAQNIHQIVPTFLDLPIDYWTFANDIIPPINSWITTGGIFYARNNIKLSIIGFYRKTYNIIKILPSENFLEFQKPWYKKVDLGKEQNFGFETALEYSSKKLYLNINYTYSPSYRYFFKINNGQKFHYKYDRTHYLKMFSIFRFNKKLNISLTWVYSGGFWTTIANQIIPYNNIPNYMGPFVAYFDYNLHDIGYPYYTSINNYRLPPYHRMDLNINYTIYKKHYSLKFTLGAYNLYNHFNIFSVFILDGKYYALALFPIIPYLSINLNF